MARSRRHVTSAALVSSSVFGHGRAERVEALLAGESIDTSRVSYDFDANHVALVAAGEHGLVAIEERANASGLQHLLVQGRGVAWGWLGRRDGFAQAELEMLVSGGQSADLRLAIGEPAPGLAGWRLTHHQARAALAVASRADEPVVRYADVALLSAVVRDDVLASSLRRLYLEPLDDGRGGGEDLRQTLRAYFEADRNVSVAATAIGVTRQAVARRLRAVEERLGRSIASCGADLEVALRLDALEAAPMRRPAP